MQSVVKSFGLQKMPGLRLLALGLTLGTAGVAQADYYGGGQGYHRYHQGRHCEQRYYPGNRQVAPPWGYQQHYAQPPQVVIYTAPRTVYQSSPGYGGGYSSPPGYGGGYNAGPSYGGGAQYGRPNRLLNSAVMGAAGGFLGSQIGRGEGRAAATAAGAVAGWVIGGNLGGQ